MKKLFKHCIIMLFFSFKVFSLPLGAESRLGEAMFFEKANELDVFLKTEKTIIDWKDFNISAQETVRFNQPSKDSAVLNRITGNNTSFLLGNLESNGSLFLLNQNGIIIGQDAHIKADSFFASTLKLLDFNSKNDLEFYGDQNSSIINLGKIEAEKEVYLISKSIKNYGQIFVKNGGANLIASTKVLIKPNNEDNIFIQIDEKEEVKNEIGIENSGLIKAIKTNLSSKGNIYQCAIKHSGVIEANGIKNINGEIYLVAKDGLIQTKKNAQLISKNENLTGGRVNILADEIRLEGKTLIDVSSELGEGEVNIGGGYRGKDDRFFNSQMTAVSKNVKINADATVNGNGGKIILWSDGGTTFHGSISTKGGEISGDGGFIEISGIKQLNFDGEINTSAKNGFLGTMLLDPSNITIGKKDPSGGSFNGQSPSDSYVLTAAAAFIDLSDLYAALDSANVVIDTDSAFSSTGDICLCSSFCYFPQTINSGSLTLIADRNIDICGLLRYTALAGSNVSINCTAGNDFTTNSMIEGTEVTLNFTANDVILKGGFSITDLKNFNIISSTDVWFGPNVSHDLQCKSSAVINITAGNDIKIEGDFSCIDATSLNLASPNDITIEKANISTLPSFSFTRTN
ncbi:MAG: Heme/hemopexin-binding protein [Candidatus Anoxychlamydiales bacterium]|nr:Heme/hemopexin-binding protein [Candidatus Anoxychlamydiales bacterium]